MKNLAIAFVVALAASTLVFYVMRTIFGIEEKVAQAAAGLPLAALPKLLEELERRDARARAERDAGPAEAIVSLDAYALPWPMMFLYASVVLFGVTNVSILLGGLQVGLLTGMSGGSAPLPLPVVMPMIGVLALPYILVGHYLTGRWIGKRAPARGVPCLLLAMVASFICSKVIDFWLTDEAAMRAIYEVEREFLAYLVASLRIGGAGVAGFTVVALIGFWRGRRGRFTNYVGYLLGVLPKDTREALVTLAFEEAQTLASRRAAAQPASAAPAMAAR